MTITAAALRESLGMPKTCNVCQHLIERYGSYGYRCTYRCPCLLIGCVPTPAPDNPNLTESPSTTEDQTNVP